MGIPYSRQMNAAFDQVTPLVVAGYKVLETTKNIAILLAWIEVLTVILLFSILLALFGLLISVNPDLEEERREVVTPVVKWFFVHRNQFLGLACLVVGTAVVSFVKYPYMKGKEISPDEEDGTVDDGEEKAEEDESPKATSK